MKKPAHQLIAEAPVRRSKVEMMIGIDLGDVWSHYCTLNEEGEVIDRRRFRTSPKGVEKWSIDVPPARVAERRLSGLDRSIRGDASAFPFIRFPAENSASGEAPSDKSWGCGGKAPAAYAATKLIPKQGAL